MKKSFMATTSFFLMLTALCPPGQAPASPSGIPDVAGLWQGTVEFQGVSLRLIFHFETRENGIISATLDSPDQGAAGIPVREVFLAGDSIHIDVAVAAASFTGKYEEEKGVFTGSWNQAGMSLPVTLGRIDRIERPNRPQEPQSPYPYMQEEVAYENKDAGVSLAGTLTIPKGEGPFPAAVLITGSGPQNRDEEIMGHRPFLVLSDYLTRKGIAVLRSDDRGMGKSTGDFKSATSEDFTGDVLAALEFMQKRPEIDHERTGLVGHSEGGLIAPVAANRNGNVAFVVMLAGPGMRGDDLLLCQTELVLKAEGYPDTLLAKVIEQKKREHSILAAEKDDAAARRMILGTAGDMMGDLTAAELEFLGLDEEKVQETLGQRADIYLTPWFRYFMSYDPAPALERVGCPILALYGERDLQVPPAENAKLVKEALERGGNRDYTTREFPGLNHLFQGCGTGSPVEYPKIEETISPLVLETISAWILERCE